MNGYRFNSPPQWPAPPPGWEPPSGWTPPPDWPSAPADWQFWIPEDARSAPAPPQPVATESNAASVPLFGARKRARELGGEVEHLRAEVQRLGAMESVQIQQEISALREQRAREAAEAEAARQRVQGEIGALQRQVGQLKQLVVELDDAAILQEVGVYEYAHPLADADAYKDRLASLRERIKAAARKDGGAVESTSSWTVNGNAAEGRRMVTQTSKLMPVPTTPRPTRSCAASAPTDVTRAWSAWPRPWSRSPSSASRCRFGSPPPTTVCESRSCG